MKFRVLSVAYPLMAVGPDAVGGSEQVLTMLDAALTKAGHESLVLAAQGSTVSGTLIASPKANGQMDDSARRWGQQVHRQLLRDTLMNTPVDLVHMHSLDFHCYLPEVDLPVLATLHLPPDWYPQNVFERKRRNFYLNCVSSSQQRGCPASCQLLPAISNGIDVERFDWKSAKANYVLAMGRICPEKGFHLALDAARKARSEMMLAGEVFPYASHQEYFAQEIKPRLDEQRRFLGPVKFARKRRLLSHAKCLLVTSSVAETSSLVTMEALASGTPVIAFPSGALPEIIEHGRTGFLVNNVKEMARAIQALDTIRPEDCRDAARTRFSAGDMTQRYLELYNRIVSTTANAQEEEEGVRVGTSWMASW
jgi:glycosyltransferase involved in cell wall biosynthesis